MASRSLSRRLGLGFAAIGVGAALLTAVLVNLAFGSRFDTYLDQQRDARMQQIAAAVATAYRTGDEWDLQQLERLAPGLAMTGAEVRVLDAAGESVWSTADSTASGMAEMHRAMSSIGPLTDPVDVPVTVDGEQRGTLIVRLPEGSVPVADQQFRSAINQLLLAGGIGVAVVAALVGLLFARRVTRPVTELTAAAHDLRSGNRARRASVTGRDEVAELGQAFNDLAEAAERQEALRQSFAADVAHELRTPLAILRGQLEAVQDGVVEPSPALIASLHGETLRLGRLVADLETLTSAEAVSFILERTPVDLADVVATVLAALDHRLAEAALQPEARLGPAVVHGDRTRLAQVVTNLLTNAVKFVPPGGRVTVHTERRGEVVVMTVRDDGPGIPEAELPHVFDRYFRGSRARASGSGIGLAVVAALVQAHGGTVEAGNAAEGGAIFTVRLPAAGTESLRPRRADAADPGRAAVAIPVTSKE